MVAQQRSILSSTGRPYLTWIDGYSRVRCLIRFFSSDNICATLNSSDEDSIIMD